MPRLLGALRCAVRRVRFAYDPPCWGLLSPLGMYRVCTYRFSGALDAPFLVPLAKTFVSGAGHMARHRARRHHLFPAAPRSVRARPPQRAGDGPRGREGAIERGRGAPSLIVQRGER